MARRAQSRNNPMSSHPPNCNHLAPRRTAPVELHQPAPVAQLEQRRHQPAHSPWRARRYEIAVAAVAARRNRPVLSGEQMGRVSATRRQVGKAHHRAARSQRAIERLRNNARPRQSAPAPPEQRPSPLSAQRQPRVRALKPSVQASQWDPRQGQVASTMCCHFHRRAAP